MTDGPSGEKRRRLQALLSKLFLNDELDNITPVTDARTVFDAIGSQHKSFWVFPGLEHVDALFYNRDEFVSLLVTFWRDPSATRGRRSSAGSAVNAACGFAKPPTG